MCQEREPDVVKGVLPYWPRIYCRISVELCRLLNLVGYNLIKAMHTLQKKKKKAIF